MHLLGVASAIVVSLVAFGASADPLRPDQFSSTEQSAFVRWLQSAGSATASCNRTTPKPPHESLQLTRRSCEIYREEGKPSSRVRRLEIDAKDLTWKGHRIVRIEYEQSFSITENLVYHAAAVYTLDGEYREVAKKVQALWVKQEHLVEQDVSKGGLFVTRNAITQSVAPARRQTKFMSEFHE